jgi:WD40 repeat protein
VIGALAAASALAGGACGKSRMAHPDGSAGGIGIGGAGGDAGVTAAAIGLTPCRDLSPIAIPVAAAASPYFLAVGSLGASVIATDGWQVRRTFTGQLGHVAAGALAPDASWGATIGDDNALRLWRASDGKETGRLVLETAPTAVAVSPPGDRVAVGETQGAVSAVDPTTGVRQWMEYVSAGAVRSLHFAPDGKTLLVGTPTGFQWRDAASGALLRAFPDPPDGGAGADAGIAPTFAFDALSVDGARVAYATGGFDAITASTVTVVAAADGAPIGPVISGLNRASALAFSNDGTQLLIASAAGGLWIYDLATGARVREIGSNLFTGSLAVSADGKTIAATTAGLSFYNFSDGTLLNTFGQNWYPWGTMFARDGRRLEFPTVDGPAQVWDASQGKRLGLFDRPTSNGNQGSVIFTPSDQLLAFFNGTGTTWDVDQGTVVSTVTLPTTGYDTITGALLTPDGRTLIGYAAQQITGKVQFWDAGSGAALRTLQAHGNITALALSPAGDVLASAGWEQQTIPSPPAGNEIKLWDVAQGTLLATLQGHTNQINDMAFSPDGTLLISGDQDGLVRLWSVPGGQKVRDFASGFNPVTGAEFNYYGNWVAFSPDGTKVASAGVDWTITAGHTGVIAIWSVADGSLVGKLLSLAEANLGHIVWSPAGFMAAGTGYGMRVWCLDEMNGI